MNATKTRVSNVVSLPVSKKKAPSSEEDLGIVDQTKTAFKRENMLATMFGFLLGGIVPFVSFMVAHHDSFGIMDPKNLLVLGGLVFSFITVCKWGQKAFASNMKAVGFVVLIEGTMVFSSIQWLSVIALGFLVAINGIATGVNLALAKKKR